MNQLIKGAKIYQKGAFRRADIMINNGVIADIGDDLKALDNAQVISCPDCFVMPGFADVRTQLGEPGFSYRETVAQGTLAAAKGGYTALMLMPNTVPPPDCAQNILIEKEAVEKDALIYCRPYGCLTVDRRGREPADCDGLSAHTTALSDGDLCVQDKEIMEKVMKQAAKRKLIVAARCDDEPLSSGGCVHDGIFAREHGLKGIPSEAEYRMVERDLRLCKKHGTRYHVCQVSCAETVSLIRRAKSEGVNVTCDVSPHHLLLCDEDISDAGRFRVDPPIRSAADREALAEGLRDGTIDIIACCHSPRSRNEKRGGLKNALPGLSALETAFPAVYTGLVKTGVITLEKLVELVSVNPRRVFSLNGAAVEEGAPADLCIWRLNTHYRVDPHTFLSKCRSTPFEGMELYGVNVMTQLGARVCWLHSKMS